MTPEEISRRVAALIANLQAELARIDAKAGEARQAAIAASGLPVEFLRQVLGKPGLTQNEPYETIEPMSTSFVPTPRKVGRPLSGGPVSRSAKKLGMKLAALAEAIDVNENTLKTWNARKAIPADAQKKIDALLAAKAKREAAK